MRIVIDDDAAPGPRRPRAVHARACEETAQLASLGVGGSVMAPTQAATAPGEHFKALVALVNKLQAVRALMGANAVSPEDGTAMPGPWATLPLIWAIARPGGSG